MDAKNKDTIVAALLQDMSKGQHAIFVQALEQLRGELRLDWERIALGDTRQIEVDATDGPIILRIVG